jgi:hypothetical protein
MNDEYASSFSAPCSALILERAVGLKLTISELQSGALAAWRRARRKFEPQMYTIHTDQTETETMRNFQLCYSYPCLSVTIFGRFVFGAEGETRTLEASLEDSHVSNYITSAF